ncbi:MAG: hypothetical protein ACI9MC_002545 [Kiritimatiellia bacterium]|jgi:hypothetical protein
MLLTVLSLSSFAFVPTSLPSSAGGMIYCDTPASLAALHAPRRYTEIAQQLRPGTPLTLVLSKYGRSIEWSRTTPTAQVLTDRVEPHGYALVGGKLVAGDGASGVLKLGDDGVLVAGVLSGAEPVDALKSIDTTKPGCWLYNRRSTALTYVDVAARVVESSIRVGVLLGVEGDGMIQKRQLEAAKKMAVEGVVPRHARVPSSVGVPVSVARFNVPDAPFGGLLWGETWAPGGVRAEFPGFFVLWTPSARPAATVRAAVSECQKNKMSTEKKIEGRMWTCVRMGRTQYFVQLDDAVAQTDNDMMAAELLKGAGTPWWSRADRMQEPGTIVLNRGELGDERRSMQTVDNTLWTRLAGHAETELAVPGLEFGGYDDPGMNVVPFKRRGGVVGGAETPAR